MSMTVRELRKKLKAGLPKARSVWDRGCYVYALELLEDFDGDDAVPSEETLLNGAEDWRKYSRGGCALISDCDIAERLCTPSELKRTKNGQNRPNSREDWIEVQARALIRAYRIIQWEAKKCINL